MVAPRCQMDEDTLKWACYGKRVLDGVSRYEQLSEALEDVTVAIALSRRDGKNRHRHLTTPQIKSEILDNQVSGSKVALVFGNEESGLSREHLTLCHFSAEIPVVAPDGSLNLAHAVTATLYELIGRGIQRENEPAPVNPHEEAATTKELSGLMQQAERTLAKVDYPRHRSTLTAELVKLQSIVNRAELESWEVRLLQGMLKQINYRLDNPQ